MSKSLKLIAGVTGMSDAEPTGSLPARPEKPARKGSVEERMYHEIYDAIMEHRLPPRTKLHSCQSTHLLAASVPLSRWDLRQYLRDVTHNGFTAVQVVQSLFIVVYNRISRTFKRGEFGGTAGTLTRTPAVELNLQPGELVEVLSREEITATLDGYAQNRGLLLARHQSRLPLVEGTPLARGSSVVACRRALAKALKVISIK